MQKKFFLKKKTFNVSRLLRVLKFSAFKFQELQYICRLPFFPYLSVPSLPFFPSSLFPLLICVTPLPLFIYVSPFPFFPSSPLPLFPLVIYFSLFHPLFIFSSFHLPQLCNTSFSHICDLIGSKRKAKREFLQPALIFEFLQFLHAIVHFET